MIAANASPIPMINTPVLLMNSDYELKNKREREHPINRER